MNWTAIDATAVKTAKNAVFLDTARSIATAHGDGDPLPEMIADVVATIRAAVSTGNALDADTTKIPNSLKGMAVRMVVRRLKDYIQQPLTTDELKQADDDRSYLNRIIDGNIQFEKPDTSAGDAEMQEVGGLEQITGDGTVATRDTMKGL
jgi:hypothetical protein